MTVSHSLFVGIILVSLPIHAFHVIIHHLTMLHGAIMLLIFIILSAVENFAEVIDCDPLIAVFIGHLHEDGFFIGIDVAQVELLENVTECVDCELSIFIYIE